jgi:hypothetical protein
MKYTDKALKECVLWHSVSPRSLGYSVGGAVEHQNDDTRSTVMMSKDAGCSVREKLRKDGVDAGSLIGAADP